MSISSNKCLTCRNWERTDDKLVGLCVVHQGYRFQLEDCAAYAFGDPRGSGFTELPKPKRVVSGHWTPVIEQNIERIRAWKVKARYAWMAQKLGAHRSSSLVSGACGRKEACNGVEKDRMGNFIALFEAHKGERVTLTAAQGRVLLMLMKMFQVGAPAERRVEERGGGMSDELKPCPFSGGNNTYARKNSMRPNLINAWNVVRAGVILMTEIRPIEGQRSSAQRRRAGARIAALESGN